MVQLKVIIVGPESQNFPKIFYFYLHLFFQNFTCFNIFFLPHSNFERTKGDLCACASLISKFFNYESLSNCIDLPMEAFSKAQWIIKTCFFCLRDKLHFLGNTVFNLFTLGRIRYISFFKFFKTQIVKFDNFPKIENWLPSTFKYRSKSFSVTITFPLFIPRESLNGFLRLIVFYAIIIFSFA